MSKSKFDKLRKIASDELSKLKDEVILQHKDGYLLYNRFKLKKIDDVYEVYEGANVAAKFFTSASAVAWVNATMKRQYKLADQINKLDTQIHNRKNEHEFYLIRIQTAKDEERLEMYRAKWEENYTRLKHFRVEMRKLIEFAKYIQ